MVGRSILYCNYQAIFHFNQVNAKLATTGRFNR
jgi:hypothetical protein